MTTLRGDDPPATATASVIICTYSKDRWADLGAAVESVLGQVTDQDEILVVVDYNPSLADDVRSKFAMCTVLENGFSRGLSGARNTGVAVARGDVALFLDDDAVAAPGWLDAHVAAYVAQDVAGTAGVVWPNWDAGGPPAWFPEKFDWVVGCNNHRMEPSGALIRNPVGANMGFRRQHVIEAGGFSDRLGRTTAEPLGCEETELAIRITQIHPGSHIVSVPEAVCLHRVPDDRTTWKYFRRRCVAEGRSKARVARLTGLGSATSSERRYTTHVLPSAVSSAVRHGHLRRAMAMLAGVCFAIAGFVPALIEQSDAADSDRFAATPHLEIRND